MTAVKRSIGGGNEGEGGPLGDAAPISKPNPNTGRAQTDNGVAPNVNETLPTTQAEATLDDDFTVAQFIFQAEFDDVLVAHAFDSAGNEVDENVFIAKPPALRVSIYELIDGITKEGVPGRRKILVGTLERFEILTQPYAVGDLIYGATSLTTGITGVARIDLNVDARYWIDEEPDEQWFIVIDTFKDVLQCRVWDWTSGAAVLPDPLDPNPEDPILVAKIAELRGSEWVGQTIAGVTYAVIGGTAETDPHNERNGDDGAGTDEDQEIIPVYLESLTTGYKFLAKRCNIGTGAFHAGVESLWQAQGPNAWSKKA